MGCFTGEMAYSCYELRQKFIYESMETHHEYHVILLFDLSRLTRPDSMIPVT